MINNNLIKVGKEIEAELIKIRESVNAPIGDCTIEPIADEFVITGRELKERASSNPNEPIINKEGECTFVYIKDHTYHDLEYHNQKVKSHPNRCFTNGKKVHFYTCQTIQTMPEDRFNDRYHGVTRINNIRKINLRDAEINTRLPWCKWCIQQLIDNGQLWRENTKSNRKQIAEYGNAKELLDCVKFYYNSDSSAIQRIQNFYYATQRKK